MAASTRKTPDSAALASQAESFIAGQTHGAGTWQDGSEVPINVIPGATLRIRDKVGTDNGGSLRHIELVRSGRVVATLVYSHHTRQLIRTF